MSASPGLTAVSAFVPAFNEADRIANVIARLHRALTRITDRHEVIAVVYEGCTDGTDRVVRALVEDDPLLRLVLQPAERKGYGVALRLGIDAARYDYIFYTDGDEQFDPEELEKLVALMPISDIVTGYRIDRQDPLARRLTAAAYNLVVDTILKTGVRDVDCSFKLFRRRAVAELPLCCDSGMIDPEIICRARRAGHIITEVGVQHYPRRSGSTHFEAGFGLPSPRVVVEVLRDLWRLKRRLDASDEAGQG